MFVPIALMLAAVQLQAVQPTRSGWSWDVLLHACGLGGHRNAWSHSVDWVTPYAGSHEAPHPGVFRKWHQLQQASLSLTDSANLSYDDLLLAVAHARAQNALHDKSSEPYLRARGSEPLSVEELRSIPHCMVPRAMQCTLRTVTLHGFDLVQGDMEASMLDQSRSQRADPPGRSEAMRLRVKEQILTIMRQGIDTRFREQWGYSPQVAQSDWGASILERLHEEDILLGTNPVNVTWLNLADKFRQSIKGNRIVEIEIEIPEGTLAGASLSTEVGWFSGPSRREMISVWGFLDAFREDDRGQVSAWRFRYDKGELKVKAEYLRTHTRRAILLEPR